MLQLKSSFRFFYQFSKICHTLQSITILFENDVSDELKELKELISLQNNLKKLTLSAYGECSTVVGQVLYLKTLSNNNKITTLW
jgi:hypothetical protein